MDNFRKLMLIIVLSILNFNILLGASKCINGEINGVSCTNITNEVQAAPSVCGNGILEVGEGCDDRNRIPGDGCSHTCLIENEFRCRDNAGCQSGYCNRVCSENHVAECGNGRLDPGEACDDNDLDNGDGCNSQCFIEDTFRCLNNAGCASQNCVNHICEVSVDSNYILSTLTDKISVSTEKKTIDVVLAIEEDNGGKNSDDLIISLPKESIFDIEYNNNATSINGVNLSNSEWKISEDGVSYILTYVGNEGIFPIHTKQYVSFKLIVSPFKYTRGSISFIPEVLINSDEKVESNIKDNLTQIVIDYSNI